jgi:hypothetical protein
MAVDACTDKARRITANQEGRRFTGFFSAQVWALGQMQRSLADTWGANKFRKLTVKATA